MDFEIEESYIIRNDFPQAIEFKVQRTAVSVDCSSNVVSSLSPLRLEPVNIHEEALLKTIRNQAKKSRPSKYHNLIQSIYRSDPPLCTNRDPPAYTNQLSEETFKEKMTVNTSNFEANFSLMEREERKVSVSAEQTVDISSKELDMEPATKTIEEKLVEANSKLDAVQIMLEISKLEAEAEATAKAAGVAIQKAKQALAQANEEANITQQEADGNKELKNLNRAITECIEKTIQNAENQVTIETIDERADSVQETFANNEEKREGISVIDVRATTDKDFDCSSAPLLNDKEFESLPVPVPDLPENEPDSPVHQIDTKEVIPTINDSTDLSSIVLQSSVVSKKIVGNGVVKVVEISRQKTVTSSTPDDPPVHQIDMKEEMPFIINLVDPPSIIRQGSIPSPTPDEDVTCADSFSFCSPSKNREVMGGKDEPFITTEVLASSTLESCDLEEQNSPLESSSKKIEDDKTAKANYIKPKPEQRATADVSKRCELSEVVASSPCESCNLEEQSSPMGSYDMEAEGEKNAEGKHIEPKPEHNATAEESKQYELPEVAASSTFKSCESEEPPPTNELKRECEHRKRYVSPCLLAWREQNPPLGSSDKEIEVEKTTKPKYTRPKPEQHAAAEESKHCELNEQNTKGHVGAEVRASNTNSVGGILEVLYSKIEECRRKLMDPKSSMEEQAAAAQSMTQYALSAQALKKAL